MPIRQAGAARCPGGAKERKRRHSATPRLAPTDADHSAHAAFMRSGLCEPALDAADRPGAQQQICAAGDSYSDTPRPLPAEASRSRAATCHVGAWRWRTESSAAPCSARRYGAARITCGRRYACDLSPKASPLAEHCLRIRTRPRHTTRRGRRRSHTARSEGVCHKKTRVHVRAPSDYVVRPSHYVRRRTGRASLVSGRRAGHRRWLPPFAHVHFERSHRLPTDLTAKAHAKGVQCGPRASICAPLPFLHCAAPLLRRASLQPRCSAPVRRRLRAAAGISTGAVIRRSMEASRPGFLDVRALGRHTPATKVSLLGPTGRYRLWLALAVAAASRKRHFPCATRACARLLHAPDRPSGRRR